MSFLSLQFPLLLAALLLLMFLIRNGTVRKWLMLAASCVFYAWWDWRFLSLLAWVAVMDYSISVAMARTEHPLRRKLLFAISLTSNLTILAFFKYFNFFVGSFNALLQPLGARLPELAIILPLGVSFYIFETLSYSIDNYRRQMTPARSLLDYAVFITFFPRIASGPIVRASRFLPQLERGMQFSRENFLTGARLFGQGLVKKVVVADSLAMIASPVYAFPELFSSASVWLGVLAYAIQVYFDFSGYSDMAIGVARVFGFELPVNFNLPYTARSEGEFWQRWHISLSSWFRDYVFFPLRRSLLRSNARMPVWLSMALPAMVTMLLSGLWHGAAWNFVIWGGMRGVALSVGQVSGADRGAPSAWKTSRDAVRSLALFLWCVVTFVVFHSSSFALALVIFKKLLWIDSGGITWFFAPACAFIVIVIGGGLFMRHRHIDLDKLDLTKPYALPAIVSLYLFALLFAVEGASPFIYFQF